MTALAGLEVQSPIVTQVDDCSKASHSCKYYPIQPSASQVGLPKVGPEMHVGYAVTWYGLAAAGLYMTRKLILKR